MDLLKDIVDVVVHFSHSIEAFFCGRVGECIVITMVHSSCIAVIETSIGGELVGSGGCVIIGKLYER